MLRLGNESSARKAYKSLSARLPHTQSIISVFTMTWMIFYGWTIFNIAWKLRSWLNNLSPWEISSLISYFMVFNVLEAILVVAALLVLCFLLPNQMFREEFVVRGIIVVTSILASMMLHLMINSDKVAARFTFFQSLPWWWLLTITGTVFLAWFLPKKPVVRRSLREVAERASVFLLILIPSAIVGAVVVLLRYFLPG